MSCKNPMIDCRDFTDFRCSSVRDQHNMAMMGVGNNRQYSAVLQQHGPGIMSAEAQRMAGMHRIRYDPSASQRTLTNTYEQKKAMARYNDAHQRRTPDNFTYYPTMS